MKVYALKNYNSPLSSSGGAFPAIADAYQRMIGSKDLYIYGSAFTEDFSVKHIRVKYRDGIQPLLESKYVQSDLSNVFDALYNDLSRRQHVLFVGTPCQVYAVNRFIEQKKLDRSTLLTIDLVCHGTPSNKFWRQYVDLIVKHTNQQLKEIHFRYKQIDGKEKNGLAYMMADGTIRYSPDDLRVYMRLFSRNLSLNKACFNCQHRNDNLIRPGDFTIGDFWGVSEIMHDFKNVHGVSLMITNRDKADQIVKALQSDTSGKILMKECTSDSWLQFNPHINVQTKKPDKYDEFWSDYKTMGFSSLIEKWKNESMKSKIKIYLSYLSDKIGIKWKLKKLLNCLR